MINQADFFRALQHIADQDPDRVWPYDLLPGTWSDGVELALDERALDPTEAAWEALRYNPPGLAEALYPDPDTRLNLRPKPSWADVLSAVAPSTIIQCREELLTYIDADVQARITAAYVGAEPVPNTLLHEMLYRMRAADQGTDISSQHSRRNHIYARGQKLRAWVLDSSRTLSDLAALDLSSDVHWE